MADNKYAGTQTEKNLQEAFAGESQARNKYTYFASVAQKEGYEQMSALFLKTADNEKEHAKMWFKELAGIGDTKENLAAAAAICSSADGEVRVSRCTRGKRNSSKRIVLQKTLQGGEQHGGDHRHPGRRSRRQRIQGRRGCVEGQESGSGQRRCPGLLHAAHRRVRDLPRAETSDNGWPRSAAQPWRVCHALLHGQLTGASLLKSAALCGGLGRGISTWDELRGEYHLALEKETGE